MKGSDRSCTVTEYRVDAKGGVDGRLLGCVDCGDGPDVERYVQAVCATQGEPDGSVVVVRREPYGVNEASFVCLGGKVVRREGGSGCFRVDELVDELKGCLRAEAERKRKETPLWKRVFTWRPR